MQFLAARNGGFIDDRPCNPDRSAYSVRSPRPAGRSKTKALACLVELAVIGGKKPEGYGTP
jgi:hypothetical protein